MTDTKPVELEVRKIPFEFDSDIDVHWIPREPELSSMMNGGSLVMPYLEPFLMRTMREAKNQVSDPRLLQEISDFIGQEGQHYQVHNRFNQILKEKRYPELAELEQEMAESYRSLGKRPLRIRMAYTAGFEAMTMGVTKWIIGRRVQLFAGADPRVTSFVLWHMVEETEHKRVAHDAYLALYGNGLKAYLARARGVFHGSFDVIKFTMRGYKVMLKKDGLWSQFRSRMRLAARLSAFVWHAGPFLFRAALPWHDPRSEKDLEWVTQWLNGYDANAAEPPLVDTNHPQMPVPFTTAKA